MERTEEQILATAPLRVSLGGEEHEVKLLVARDSRKWREEAVKLLASLPDYANIDTDDGKKFGAAMKALMVGLPDKVVDLFFLYAKDLKRNDIEAVATDYELSQAFTQVSAAAFPFVEAVSSMAAKIVQ